MNMTSPWVRRYLATSVLLREAEHICPMTHFGVHDHRTLSASCRATSAAPRSRIGTPRRAVLRPALIGRGGCYGLSSIWRTRRSVSAAQDGCRGLWVRLGVPLSFFSGAAQDAVPGAWYHVGYALRVVFVEYEAFEAGVAHAHDLAPYRLHRWISDELARSEPRAVDYHATLPGLLQRRDGAVLDAPTGPEEAIQQVAEVDGHLDDRCDESVAVGVAGRQRIIRAPADARHCAGPPGVGDRLAPDLHPLAHAHPALGDAGQILEDLEGPAPPGEHPVLGVGFVR